MKVSVICPFYNEERYVRPCVESILRQDFPKTDMEVLFVDGMSTDGSRRLLDSYCSQYPFMKVLDNPDRIVPCAMNLAIAQSSGEFILRLDMHAAYETNYVSALVSRSEELNAANVGCPMQTNVLHKTSVSLAIREVLCNRFGVGNATFRLGVDKVKEVDTVPFGCFLRSVFEKYGLYDVRLVRNQDIELNKRIVRNGGKIFIVPDTSCTYFAREKYSALAKNNFQNGKWNILTVFYTKEFQSLSLRHFVPLLFLCSLVIPSLLGLFFSPFFYLSLVSFSLYLLLISYETCRIVRNNGLSFVCLILAFITLHLSYGVGSVAGVVSLPFLKR